MKNKPAVILPLAIAAAFLLFAGGFLAARLTNGADYTIQAERGAPEDAVAVFAQSGGEEERIDINTASADELATLPGIGATRAAAIIEYRESHGGFASVADIMEVPGIGEGIFEEIRDRISVGPETEKERVTD